MTKEEYIKDLEGCEFHFLDLGIVGCEDGILIDGGKPAWIYAEKSGRKIHFNLHNLPKCWAEACFLSHANYEWPGTEEVSLKEAWERMGRMYA